eukprot:5425086-Prymnesium_polylepis.1
MVGVHGRWRRRRAATREPKNTNVANHSARTGGASASNRRWPMADDGARGRYRALRAPCGASGT